MIGRLVTERLVLRPLEIGDAEMMLALLNEPSFLRNIGDRGVRTVDQARTYLLEGPMAMYEEHGLGLLHVALRKEGEGDGGGTPIGICGLIDRPSLDDVDVGFALFPAFWSQGYAFEAAKACLEHGRDALGLPRVVAIVQPDNGGSIRLLERLGLALEKTFSSPKPDGTHEELHLFAIDFA